MRGWIVRHACAGHREDWQGEDDERPLDEAGARQAVALADQLAARPLTRLVSSPARRCVDTLAPLAARTGLTVRTDDALRPGAGPEPLLDLLERAPGALACTHGEVLRPLLDRLRAEGLHVEGAAGGERLLLKGAAWELWRDGLPWRVRLQLPVPVPACPHHG